MSVHRAVCFVVLLIFSLFLVCFGTDVGQRRHSFDATRTLTKPENKRRSRSQSFSLLLSPIKSGQDGPELADKFAGYEEHAIFDKGM